MTAANKKTIIGLTGNIATGKSVVRKMLEHLGAYTIDADSLTHRVMEQDGPAFQPIIDQFGKFILTKDNRIDRGKLGKLVFTDPEALESLEAIIHPYVRQAVDYLINRASQDAVVIEAIKLLESPLREKCDTIWVTTTSEENQMIRLTTKRGMSFQDAKQRMEAQTPQALKAAEADTLIKNDGTIEDAWKQVLAGWTLLFPNIPAEEPAEPTVAPVEAAEPAALAAAELRAERARPNQAQSIADLINKLSSDTKNLTRLDIMTAFGEKAYMLLITGDQLVGLAGWQVENLIVRIDEVWLEPELNISSAITTLMEEIETAGKQLQAEAALAFIPDQFASEENTWTTLGFEARRPEEIQVNAWREAAQENQIANSKLLFKQLRIDRVLRPL